MKLAVFTNHFPGRVNTFFARDMRALIEAGVTLDVFPLYPLHQELWRYVPEFLSEKVLPRERVHHIGLHEAFGLAGLRPGRDVARFLRDTWKVRASAVGYGPVPVAKTEYVFLKAWAWARQHIDAYDHVLAYWGNYSATCAYIFHRLMTRPVPFSTFLHAGTDLYRDQVFLREKLLYADNIFVVCNFNREFIRALYPDIYPKIENRISPYHLGLDLRDMRFSLENRRPAKVLGVGSLEKFKGFDYLVRAAGRLAERGIGIDVELIGGGPERERLEHLAARLGIGSRVRFRGLLRFEDVRVAMAQAAILVHPSTGLGDAVPTVIKEAMALGTPVIASRLAGIPELLDDGRCGVLVPPEDVDALAGAIERLLSDATLGRRYAHTARAYAEQHFDLWKNGSALARRLTSSTRGQAAIVQRAGRES